jgi:hypothetical protein
MVRRKGMKRGSASRKTYITKKGYRRFKDSGIYFVAGLGNRLHWDVLPIECFYDPTDSGGIFRAFLGGGRGYLMDIYFKDHWKKSIGQICQ